MQNFVYYLFVVLLAVLLNNPVKYFKAAASLMNESYAFTMYSVYVCVD